MEIISSSPRELFERKINKLLSDMVASYNNGNADNNARDFQQRLDKLAISSQRNISLGKLRYKLYEAQAYIHFFRNDYDEAEAFIKEAIKIRGENFDGAKALEKLMAESNSNNNYQEAPLVHVLDKFGKYVKNEFNSDWGNPDDSSQEITTNSTEFESELNPEDDSKTEQISNKAGSNLAGVRGWLAYFTLGIFISIGYSVYNAYTYAQLLHQGVNPTYHAEVVGLTIGFVILALLQLVSVILIFKNNYLAKQIIIITLIAGMILYGIDASFENTVYSNINQSVPSSFTDTVSRTEVLSMVWILYFVISKRVKATFIK